MTTTFCTVQIVAYGNRIEKHESLIGSRENTNNNFKRLLPDLCVLIFLLFFLQNSYAIDCRKINNFSEALICGDASLLRLDNLIDENYSHILNSNISTDVRRDLKKAQRRWIGARNQCSDKACIADSYKERLSEVCNYSAINKVHPGCLGFNTLSKNNLNIPDRFTDADLNKPYEVKFLCDFKGREPNFYVINDGNPKRIADSGLEWLTPIFNKFVGSKMVLIDREYYLFGYFLSIHDATERIAPNSVGAVYVKRSEVICVDVGNIF